ncbi:hypothetical protein [Chitinophaga tropicalis]|uniref:HTH cro/C1-type domain-containing protein n=1 Tax=Chitinophaga tropicalis TaxID=2683588 RepID=A0A7K1UDH8_9BACT|nr:hypothetical protein [Chitinophaga tropicalis]MVT12434.1 hypothetical protein [Chitinophaga tropicalis]
MDNELKDYITVRLGQVLSKSLEKTDKGLRATARDDNSMDHSWLLKVLNGEKHIKVESLFSICLAIGIKPSKILAEFEDEVFEKNKKF